MNDRDIDLVLGAIGAERTRVSAPSAFRERVRVVPLETPPPRGWLPHIDQGGFDMFSALRFIAASVIVALFGGFLLMGILTAPQGDEMAPAAVTEWPSPTSAEELLSGMVTEEVEPGVFRVVSDGYRAMADLNVNGHGSVNVTPDGSVWLSGGGGGHDLFRLGGGLASRDPERWPPFLEDAPDGSLWTTGEILDSHMGIYAFDGQEWTLRASATELLPALAVGPDGTVWVTATVEDEYCPELEARKCPSTSLLRLEDDGSLTTIDDWSGVYDGEASAYQLAVSPDGDVWLAGQGRSGGPEAEALLRFDGSEWAAIPLPEGLLRYPSARSLGFGPDGSLWVEVRGVAAGHTDARGLARFDDTGWTIFTEPDGGSEWAGMRRGDGEPAWPGQNLLTVAPDGGIWLRGRPTEGGCGGVAQFDDTTWTTYLAEACINDLDVASDGSVWLRGLQGDLHVITPEAVSATK